MSNSEFVFRAPIESKDGQKLCELFAKVFGVDGSYEKRLKHATSGYILRGMYYDWDASQICLDGDKIISHYGIWKYTSRLGKAKLLTGGAGAVMTDPDYRGKGLLKATTNTSLDAMRKQKYDISILFGIPDVYHKLGYARAWNPTVYEVEVKDLPVNKPEFKTRKITKTPNRELEKLYNSQYSKTSGTAVKPTYRHYPPKLNFTTIAWYNKTEKPAGYVIFDIQDNIMFAHEYTGKAEHALTVLTREARKTKCEKIIFEFIPDGSELIELIKLDNCVQSTRYFRNQSSMINIINLKSTMKKMCGELSERLSISPLNKYKGAMLLDNGKEKVTLSLSEGKVSLAETSRSKNAIIGNNEIGSLIYGADEPEFIAKLGKFSMRGDAEELTKVLFPNQRPLLGRMDRF